MQTEIRCHCVEPTDIQVEGVTENLTIRPFATVNFDLQRLADQVVARILLPLGDRLKQQVLDRTHAGDARFMVSAMEELIFPLQKLVQPILWSGNINSSMALTMKRASQIGRAQV